MKNVARLFIFLGILFYAFGAYNIYLRENPKKLAFDSYTAVQHDAADKNTLPVKITIQSVGIEAPVYPTGLINNVPQTIENGASYLISSPLPGTQGNSILYAHNWKNLFGPLVSVKTGDEVQVVYADGSKKTFEVRYTSVVNPSDSTILSPSSDTRITLYTCTGFLDSKRFVAVAVLKG